MLREKDLEPILGEFYSGEGYIDVIGKIEDDHYYLDITDGFNHLWYSVDFHLSELDDIESVYAFLYESIYNYDAADELELIVKNNIPGKPDFRTLIGIFQDVDKTLDGLERFFYNTRFKNNE